MDDRNFDVGDLIEITELGAWNIDQMGINAGSKGIIVEVTDDREDTGWLYTAIVNNQRIPYLYDSEIKKVE